MQVISKSASHTKRLGRSIAKRLARGDIIALFGDLGSGKTTLTKGIAEKMGVRSARVNSPTFVLLKTYKARLPLYHFDFYRAKDILDAYRIGCEEYFFGDGVSVIEWADRIKEILPKEYLAIKLFIKDENKRLLRFYAYGRRYKKLIKELYEDISS